MRCWSTDSAARVLLGCVLLALWAGPVRADDAWPTPLYVGVVVAVDDGVDPPVVARTLNEAVSLLVGSGRYHVRDDEALFERLGASPGEAARRCDQDPACWQSLLWRGGLDVLLLVELATPGDGSMPVGRVVAWSETGRLGNPSLVPLPRGGGAPLEWMADRLLQDGHLSLQVEEGGAVSVDGSPWEPGTPPLTLAPGRHQVRVQFGDEVQVQVVPVLSGRTTELALAPLPEMPDGAGGHRRWGLVAMPALAVGGAVALAIQRDRPGDAVR